MSKSGCSEAPLCGAQRSPDTAATHSEACSGLECSKHVGSSNAKRNRKKYASVASQEINVAGSFEPTSTMKSSEPVPSQKSQHATIVAIGQSSANPNRMVSRTSSSSDVEKEEPVSEGYSSSSVCSRNLAVKEVLSNSPCVDTDSASQTKRRPPKSVSSGASEREYTHLRRKLSHSEKQQRRHGRCTDLHTDACRVKSQFTQHIALYPTLRQPSEIVLDPYPNMRIRSACMVGETLVTSHRSGLRFFTQHTYSAVKKDVDGACHSHSALKTAPDCASTCYSHGVWQLSNERTDFDLMDSYLCASAPPVCLEKSADDLVTTSTNDVDGITSERHSRRAQNYSRYLAAAAGSDRSLHSVCVLSVGARFLLHHELHRKNRITALGFFLIALEPLNEEHLAPFVVSVDEVGGVVVFDVERDRAHRLMRSTCEMTTVATFDENYNGNSSCCATDFSQISHQRFEAYRLQCGQATGATLVGPCLELCNRCNNSNQDITGSARGNDFEFCPIFMTLYISSGTYDEDNSSELNITAVRFKLFRNFVPAANSLLLTGVQSVTSALATFDVPFYNSQCGLKGGGSFAESGGSYTMPSAVVVLDTPIVKEKAPESVCTGSGVTMVSRPYIIGRSNSLLLARPRLRFWSLSGCMGTLMQLRRVYTEQQDRSGIGSRSPEEFFTDLVPVGRFALTSDSATSWFLSCGLTNGGSVLLLGRQPRKHLPQTTQRHHSCRATSDDRPNQAAGNDVQCHSTVDKINDRCGVFPMDERDVLEQWLEELPKTRESTLEEIGTPPSKDMQGHHQERFSPDVARNCTFIDPTKDYTVLMHLFSPAVGGGMSDGSPKLRGSSRSVKSRKSNVTAPEADKDENGSESTATLNPVKAMHKMQESRRAIRTPAHKKYSDDVESESSVAHQETHCSNNMRDAPLSVMRMLSIPSRRCVLLVMDDQHTILSASLPLESVSEIPSESEIKCTNPKIPTIAAVTNCSAGFVNSLEKRPLVRTGDAPSKNVLSAANGGEKGSHTGNDVSGYMTSLATLTRHFTGDDSTPTSASISKPPANGVSLFNRHTTGQELTGSTGWFSSVPEISVARPLASMMMRFSNLVQATPVTKESPIPLNKVNSSRPDQYTHRQVPVAGASSIPISKFTSHFDTATQQQMSTTISSTENENYLSAQAIHDAPKEEARVLDCDPATTDKMVVKVSSTSAIASNPSVDHPKKQILSDNDDVVSLEYSEPHSTAVHAVRIQLESVEKQRSRRAAGKSVSPTTHTSCGFSGLLNGNDVDTAAAGSGLANLRRSPSGSPIGEDPSQYVARQAAELKMRFKQLGHGKSGSERAVDSDEESEANLLALELLRKIDRLMGIEEPGTRQGLHSLEAKQRSLVIVEFHDGREEIAAKDNLDRKGIASSKGNRFDWNAMGSAHQYSVPLEVDMDQPRYVSLISARYVEDDMFCLTASARFHTLFREVSSTSSREVSGDCSSRTFDFASYFESGIVPEVLNTLQDADRCKFEVSDLISKHELEISQYNEYEQVQMYQNEVREDWRMLPTTPPTDPMDSSLDAKGHRVRRGRWIPDKTFPYDTDSGDTVEISHINRNPSLLASSAFVDTVDSKAKTGQLKGSTALAIRGHANISSRTGWRWATAEETAKWKHPAVSSIIDSGAASSQAKSVSGRREHLHAIPKELQQWNLGDWEYATEWPSVGMTNSSHRWESTETNTANVRRRRLLRLRVDCAVEAHKNALAAQHQLVLASLREDLGL